MPDLKSEREKYCFTAHPTGISVEKTWLCVYCNKFELVFMISCAPAGLKNVLHAWSKNLQLPLLSIYSIFFSYITVLHQLLTTFWSAFANLLEKKATFPPLLVRHDVSVMCSRRVQYFKGLRKQANRSVSTSSYKRKLLSPAGLATSLNEGVRQEQ